MMASWIFHLSCHYIWQVVCMSTFNQGFFKVLRSAVSDSYSVNNTVKKAGEWSRLLLKQLVRIWEAVEEMECHIRMIGVEFYLKARYLVTVIWSIRTNVPDVCCGVHWTTNEDSVYVVLSSMHYRHMTFSLVWLIIIHLFEYLGKGGRG